MSQVEQQAAAEALIGFEQQPSRYVVGIDLGTTNCAVAYWDSTQATASIEVFPVEQWVDVGTSEKRELLPSFLYQPLPEEVPLLAAAGARDKTESALRVVGGLARDRGLQLPGRQVASAKSWLCHAGVDRLAPILPWQSDEGVEKLSPVEASAAYLKQIRAAWDRKHKSQPLADQDIVLTLPASFDQVARQLTIEAAAQAGLKRVLPIEEPQAAFYAWLARQADNWESQVQAGQTILVCDIGGGTTDFTLIRVREASTESRAESGGAVPAVGSSRADSRSGNSVGEASAETLADCDRGKLSLHRVAVGQHLILGGDNIDLALARLAEQKVAPGKNLANRAWDALRQACRVAKETLLGDDPPAAFTIHLPGSGSRLIGGGSQVEISADEVRSSVLDGFFPACDLDSRPDSRQTGFQEFGLPFARDAAITKHLAAFLWDHRWDGRSDDEQAAMSDTTAARPDWILFNGGVMTSYQLRRRILDCLGRWFADRDGLAADWRPGVLDGERLDLAVAIGATYFGQVRRGTGVEIEANLACSYYLQTTTDPPTAVCLVPGSAKPGDQFTLHSPTMELAVGQPVQFPILYSHMRLADRPGQRVEIEEEHFTHLPPIRTVIELSGAQRKHVKVLPVVVHAELSQIGTLHVFCQAIEGEHRWQLEFDIRASTETDRRVTAAGDATQVLDEHAVLLASHVLEDTFGEQGTLSPAKTMRRLADSLSLSKSAWPPGLLRSMWRTLLELQDGRRQSAAHEARWLNLVGYCLRPGYGMAADDWRVAQTWRRVHGKLAFPAVSSRNESLILWRRIAGGFTAGQQLTVYQQVAGPLRSVLDPQRRGKGGGSVSPHELIELLRLVASLELLPQAEKAQLGEWLLELLSVKKWVVAAPAMLWALGRLGSRVPAYGPLNCVVDSQRIAGWLEKLLRLAEGGAEVAQDANWSLAMMLCARRVDDRYRDVPEDLRARILQGMSDSGAPAHYLELVRCAGLLANEEADQIFGDTLPLGLTIRA